MTREEQIKALTAEIEEELVQIRRCIHRRPEIAREERETAALITKELEKLEGLEVYSGLAGGTGVMAVLKGGLPGKCVIVRADIDALPVQEQSGVDFASEIEGKMHACGHDAHATWVLGAAKVLSKMREQVPGTIKFIFQPGEEVSFGAKELILEDHVLENPAVDCALAAHVWPTVKAGTIGIAQRYAFGCPATFQINIKGKGGHGAMPHLVINPIAIAGRICAQAPTILAEKIIGLEPRVLTFCSIHAGTTGNIIPDNCEIMGTIRSTDMDVTQQIARELEALVKSCCEFSGASYDFSLRAGLYPVRNDPKMIEICRRSAAKMLGEEQVELIAEDHLAADNFSEFSRRVPAVYFYAGNWAEGDAEPISLHNPKFNVDERLLGHVTQVLCETVFELNQD